MISPTRSVTQVTKDDTDAIAIVHCGQAFSLGDGHPMQDMTCLLCGRFVNSDPVTVIGVTPLTGYGRNCSCVHSDLFLVHADHLPTEAEVLQVAITRGLQCRIEHDSQA